MKTLPQKSARQENGNPDLAEELEQPGSNSRHEKYVLRL
jgi:hypothetical protein